ncbi:MAG: serine/threonine protein kinase [Planctomycetales bacterium]|nr:serine/threonine protein kinase [Planctomycetales bacterium]
MESKQLGPYRIGKRIGKGGMGAVYAAVDSKTGQVAAVKALSPHLAAAEGFRERFEAEIESLKKLQHDGIVRMFGYGEDDGVLFYSMERVDGPSLDEELNNGRRFDWHETLDIAVQLCRALKHAHDHGVVHRDIKPANILLAPDGRVKLADFGIARLFGANQLTTAGGVLGTADYMSPEQADGRAVTDKCDQYALGCVMYALLTGRPPFRAKTMPEMLQMQRYAEPEPVRRYAPQTPEQLDRLIRQLLSKEPAERFPNVLVLSRHMEAMAKALSRKEAETEAASHQAAPSPDHGSSATAAPDSDATLPGEPISLITVETGGEALYDAATLAEDAAAEDDERGVSAPAERRTSRFTTVAEDALRSEREAEESHWAQWASLAGLAAALAALIYGGYRITRPASADDIYQEVTAAVADDRTSGLRDHRADIADFLERFPDDARAEEFLEYQQDLELLDMAKGLRSRVRLRGDAQAQPSARWYAAAMASRETDPAGAAEKLANLLRLFGVDPNADGDERFDDPALALDETQRRWLRAADLELRRLRETLDEDAAAQLPLLRARLATAEKIARTNPQAARRMYQGLVELYQDQPWAADVVREANGRLNQLAE